MAGHVTRRQFLQAASASALAFPLLRGRDWRAWGEVPTTKQERPKAGETKLPAGATMPMRPLGKTGVSVSLLGIGGYHLGIPEEKEALRICDEALDHGVTFFDNCWDYNGGESERRMGKALSNGKRKKAFIMTKLDGRTAASAKGQLDQSLERLRTDVIDLVQIHEVIRMEDAERVFGPGGAIEAYVEAKKLGKLRFIGFTGHKDPAIHQRMLDRAAKAGFAFDTVQMPLNIMDAHFRSFEKKILPGLVKNKIGVLGMKPLGSGKLLDSGVANAPECLRYAMSLPTSVVITGCDSVGVLEQALAAALGHEPLTDAERKRLLTRSASSAAKGRYELFKTSDRFDGTKHNPHWLEGTRV